MILSQGEHVTLWAAYSTQFKRGPSWITEAGEDEMLEGQCFVIVCK